MSGFKKDRKHSAPYETCLGFRWVWTRYLNIRWAQGCTMPLPLATAEANPSNTAQKPTPWANPIPSNQRTWNRDFQVTAQVTDCLGLTGAAARCCSRNRLGSPCKGYCLELFINQPELFRNWPELFINWPELFINQTELCTNWPELFVNWLELYKLAGTTYKPAGTIYKLAGTI